MKIVITGANRGIGLELTRQLLERGDFVCAGARSPEQAHELLRFKELHPKTFRLNACDVAVESSVSAFAQTLGNDPVDLLINSAGVMGKMQSLEELDLDDVTRSFQVNALGPLRVTRSLLPLLRKSASAKVLNITSKMGSIQDNTSGGAYGYRMSKVALNMGVRSMAVDLRAEGIIWVVVHPGWVQTDMGGQGAPVPVSESVRGLLAVADGLTLTQSGAFLGFRGEVIPW